MSDELREWIDDQAEAGAKDSTGQFTLDPSKAWEKLGALSLPYEFAWVVKLVQSAVRANSSLSVLQSREETQFTWDQPPQWTHEQVLQAVFSLQPIDDAALSHLAVAVRALAASKSSYRFSLSYVDGNVSSWTGTDLEKSRASRGGGASLMLRVKHKLGETDDAAGYLDLTKVGASIAKALQDHAQWSPRRVTLDRREISSVFGDPVFGVSDRRQPMCLLPIPPRSDFPSFRVRTQLRDPELASSSISLGPDSQALAEATKTLSQPVFTLGIVSFFFGQTQNHRGDKSHYAPTRHASQIAWIRDGVEVFRENLPLRSSTVALLIVCEAEGLETDISGMIPRDHSSKTRRMMEALRAVSKAFPNPDDQREDYALSKKGFREGWGILLLGAAASLLSVPVGVIIISVGGCNLVAQRNRGDETFVTINKDFRYLAHELKRFSDSGTAQ